MADHSKMKLGAIRSPFIPAMPRLTKYATLSTWLPDPIVDYTNGVTDFGMLGNDNAGDCVEASGGHYSQIATMGNTTPYTGMKTPADSEVIGLYSTLTGYIPGDEMTDNGTVPTDMFALWAKQPLFGCALQAVASVALENWLYRMYAISKFGGLFYGWQLPVSAQGQDVWDVAPNDGGVWGGHMTFGCGYVESTGDVTVISWGKVITVTNAFVTKYCQEQFVVLTDIGEGMMSRGPDGLDVAGLKADMTALA